MKITRTHLELMSVAQAYVDELTVDLQVECAPYGISVENQAPFYVATKMSKIRKPRLDAPSPKTWVAAGMRQIGCARSTCILLLILRYTQYFKQ